MERDEHALARRARTALLPGAALVVGACFHSGGGSHHAPPAPAFTFLTSDNLAGEDDDPAVAVDPQGDLHVVWFSDRDGTKDLYHVESTAIDVATGAIAWSPPDHVTELDPATFPSPTQGDNFPALLIDADGMLNLAWFRWNLANECHVMFLRCDGTPAGFAAAVEVPVTSGANFDRFPSLVRYASDDLRIVFSSTTRHTPGVDDVFVARSADDGASWSAPVEVSTLNEPTAQTSFPSVLQLGPAEFVAAIDRRALGTTDVLHTSTEVLVAQSSDGESWSVTPVTSDATPDVVPALYLDHAGAAHVAWTSAGFGDPFGDTLDVALAELGAYPASAHVVNGALGVADHSPHVVALTVGGRAVRVLVWVRIVDAPHNQVAYRLLDR